jgi:hypothetical protein
MLHKQFAELTRGIMLDGSVACVASSMMTIL